MAHSGQSVPDMFQRFRSASITPTIFARWGCIATAAGLTVRTMPLIAAEYTSCAVYAGQTNAAPALIIPFSEATNLAVAYACVPLVNTLSSAVTVSTSRSLRLEAST